MKRSGDSAMENGAVFPRRWHSPREGTSSGTKVYIPSDEVRETVTAQLGPKLTPDFSFYIADDEYFCTPLEDAREIIKNSALDRRKWVRERFDCDDFAHVLKAHFAEAAYADGSRRTAHCFGIVWGNFPGPHAINWMLNDDMIVRFVEPQDDTIFEPRIADDNIYFMLV